MMTVGEQNSYTVRTFIKGTGIGICGASTVSHTAHFKLCLLISFNLMTLRLPKSKLKTREFKCFFEKSHSQ